jgi:hypothetical protein
VGRPEAWQSLESDVALSPLADGGLLLSDDVGASCAWTHLVRERRLD